MTDDPSAARARARDLHGFALLAFALDVVLFYVIVQIRAIPEADRLTLQYLVRLAAAAVLATVMVRRGLVTTADLGLSFRGFGADAWWTAKLIALLLAGSAALIAIGILALRAFDVPLPPRELGVQRYVINHVLLAAVVEEFVYRSVMAPGLEAEYGRRKAVVAGMVVFYVLHLVYTRPFYYVHYLVAGAILTWTFLARRKLWICVLLHAGGNVMVVLDDLLLRYAPHVYKALVGRMP